MPTEWRNLVLSAWLQSLYRGNDYFRLVPSSDYYRCYHDYLQRVLADDDVEVRFAMLGESDVILGFSVSRGTRLHYVYVKQDVRRQGIARSLVPPGIDTVTHLTSIGMQLWANKCPQWSFNPFA